MEKESGFQNKVLKQKVLYLLQGKKLMKNIKMDDVKRIVVWRLFRLLAR